ncbi:hypothetical protein HRI96_07435 [Treponema parvum]|uniref:Tetratricopeptide repeat protein n=1 Tax=Treponema parvum TaxID=138851 RepID=A0A975F0I7_9SPIR|nr:hypothetical protein [Treponema parvum]QTQ12040.1 hypothetical protein HRI96_07435 [Treponema parvum]QTQ15984.1 hypothetical protein HXT04_04315 [Treponema parvum]
MKKRLGLLSFFNPFFPIFVFLTLKIYPQPARSAVYNVTAAPESVNSIKISWEFTGNSSDASFEIYRALRPFSAAYELSENLKIAEIPQRERSYSDKVADYKEYYYAVIVKAPDGSGGIILPSINATVNGARRKAAFSKDAQISQNPAPEKTYPEGVLREIPLPVIAVPEYGSGAAYPLKNKTVEAGENLSEKENQKPLLAPYAFEQDLVSPEGGDDYLLFDTLHKTFAKRKYEEGIIKLNEFLSVKHKKNTEDRAYFYLGQCQYFSGNFKDAVMSFLKIQDEYPILTRKWIDSSLDLISISDIAD